jgi:adenylosuccinate lyase
VIHEVIRGHSVEAARAVKDGAPRNDLIERLAVDPAFTSHGVSLDDLRLTLDPTRFVGRAPRQVDEFLAEEIEPALASHALGDAAREEVRV